MRGRVSSLTSNLHPARLNQCTIFLGHTQYNGAPHLRISLPAEGRRELHVAPLGLADVVGGGVDLGCHVQHVDAIFCHHWEKERKERQDLLYKHPPARNWHCWGGACGHRRMEGGAATSKKREKKQSLQQRYIHGNSCQRARTGTEITLLETQAAFIKQQAHTLLNLFLPEC